MVTRGRWRHEVLIRSATCTINLPAKTQIGSCGKQPGLCEDDEALLEIARYVKDKRSLTEIKRDNELVSAVEAGDVALTLAERTDSSVNSEARNAIARLL